MIFKTKYLTNNIKIYKNFNGKIGFSTKLKLTDQGIYSKEIVFVFHTNNLSISMLKVLEVIENRFKKYKLLDYFLLKASDSIMIEAYCSFESPIHIHKNESLRFKTNDLTIINFKTHKLNDLKKEMLSNKYKNPDLISKLSEKFKTEYAEFEKTQINNNKALLPPTELSTSTNLKKKVDFLKHYSDLKLSSENNILNFNNLNLNLLLTKSSQIYSEIVHILHKPSLSLKEKEIEIETLPYTYKRQVNKLKFQVPGSITHLAEKIDTLLNSEDLSELQVEQISNNFFKFFSKEIENKHNFETKKFRANQDNSFFLLRLQLSLALISIYEESFGFLLLTELSHAVFAGYSTLMNEETFEFDKTLKQSLKKLFLNEKSMELRLVRRTQLGRILAKAHSAHIKILVERLFLGVNKCNYTGTENIQTYTRTKKEFEYSDKFFKKCRNILKNNLNEYPELKAHDFCLKLDHFLLN